LDRFTGERDEAASHELFDLTIAALILLGRADNYLDGVVHAYELQLLATLGYAPVLDRCVVCGAAPGRGAGFSPALGGIVCRDDRHKAGDALPVSVEATELLQALQESDAERALALRPSPKAAADTAKALRWFVRYRSERALKSADFLDQLRATA
ncbi:MAG TPA: DNA repair protein RecO, partial [Chthonomonadaceae bacterium]|nr:DNA repair protein RecO [Chthonomonadaceae bacterium]